MTWLTGQFGDDFDVAVISNVDSIESRNFLGGGTYIISRPIEDVGDPPLPGNTCLGRYEWARSQGGFDAGSTNIRVTLSAFEGHAVTLVGARPVPIGSPRSPSVGSMLTCPGRGADNVDLLQLNLDSGEVVYLDSESNELANLSVPVVPGAPKSIDVSATTNVSDVTYDIELSLVVDGEPRTELLSNDGRHFRTSAPQNARQYQWIDEDWVDVSVGAQPIREGGVSTPIPAACSLLTQPDAESIMEVAGLNVTTDFPPQVATSATGLPVSVSNCVWGDPARSSVQLSVLGSDTAEEAADEYTALYENYGGMGEAQDLPSYVDTAMPNDTTILSRRENIVVAISVVRGSNRVELRDEERLRQLLGIALDRF